MRVLTPSGAASIPGRRSSKPLVAHMLGQYRIWHSTRVGRYRHRYLRCMWLRKRALSPDRLTALAISLPDIAQRARRLIAAQSARVGIRYVSTGHRIKHPSAKRSYAMQVPDIA
eukprot:1881926-Rhodomonas_salina.5